jgi:transglutaminase-like putative cysteine protease
MNSYFKEVPWCETMVLSVSHRTDYIYAGWVSDSYNEARLKPQHNERQILSLFEFVTNPMSKIRSYPDFYGNAVHYFDLPDFHQNLSIEVKSSLKIFSDTRGIIPSIRMADIENSEEIDSLHDYLLETEMTTIHSVIWQQAMDLIVNEADDVWLRVAKIGHYIHHHFQYQPNSTSVYTRAIDVFNLKKGVCQDFAHLMLAMCRSLKIPCRYVSGYFFNPEQDPFLPEASHAWVEVFLPGFGWQSYDPTHCRIADTRYVVLATGRDYNDVRPISGSFRGASTQSLIVDVRVRREVEVIV